MTQNAATPHARLVVSRGLLLKSSHHHHDGMYKHGGGYYLLNGRWHKLHKDKPAPKGAPIAHDPHAFSATPFGMPADQVAQLKLPDSNSNAGTFNKQVDKVIGYAAEGNAAAILGMQIGVNTYGQKLAKISNFLLDKMGVHEHVVVHGQKAGQHSALQPPAAAPDGLQEPGPLAPLAQHVKDTLDAKAAEGDVEFIKLVAANNPEHPQIVAYAQQKLAELQAKAPAPPPPAPEPEPSPAPAPAATPAALAMPDFQEGKTTAGVKAYYEKVAQKVIDHGLAGNAVVLEDMKADGLKPNAKGKVTNTWLGKTANSKKLLALHEAAVLHATGGGSDGTGVPPADPFAVPDAPADDMAASQPKPEPVSAPAPVAAPAVTPETGNLSAQQLSNLQSIPWFKLKLPAENTNAKSHNAAIAKIEAMAFAGDTAGLQSFIDGKAGAKQTYAKKQHLLAQTALAGLQVPGATAAVPVTPPPAAAGPSPEQLADLVSTKAANKVFTPRQNALWNSLTPGQKDHVIYQVDEAQKAPSLAGKSPVAVISAAKDASDDNAYDVHVAAAAWLTANPGKEPELAQALVDAGHSGVAASMDLPVPGEDDGPQEGDTKQGADGMLVLKDGHWVKVEQPAPAGPAYGALKPSHAISLGKNFSTASGNKAMLKAWAVAGNAAAIQEFIDKAGKTMPASKAYGQALLQAMAGSTAPGAPAKPAATPAPAPGAHPSMDAWAQTGPQGGSNPGGRFKDPSGQEWYCKFPADEATARSEILAAKLYGLAGLSGQDAMLVTKGGKVGIATKWVNIKKAPTAAALAKVEGAQAGFAVDAWLANWDVVGLALDNLQVGPDGKAHRVDAGGSLEYRAQGDKKPFGSKVDEIESMRDAKLNPKSAAVFGSMTPADIVASVAKVAAISDVTIRAMVNQHGPGDAEAKKALAETLIARKADLLKRFPQAAKKKKAPTFHPEKISEPPNFLNWGGSGKSGPSSKEFLNKANNDAAQAIFAAAKTGDVGAVQSLKAVVYDKDTGAAKGDAAVVSHPSQHIKGYAQQVINEINYQLNPPKRFRFDGGHPLHSLNAAYPAHHGAPSSSAAQKLGKFIVLGEPGTVKLADLGLPPTIKHSEAGGTLSQATYSKQAQAAIAKMPATQQQAIQSYTGSSYHAMNGSLWSGNPSGAAKAAGEALKTLGHDIAPGTVLSRKISLHGADLDQLLGASGKILQEPAIMSTSIRPSSWSGNVHLKLHVGPGVKGLWVGPGSKPGGGALSKHSSEDELILPPGTRLMIMSVKKGGDADGFGKNGQHVIEAVVLPT